MIRIITIVTFLVLLPLISIFSQNISRDLFSIELYSKLIPFPKSNKYGYMNRDKKIILDAKYDYAELFCKNGVAKVKINEEYFFIDTLGNILLDNVEKSAEIGPLQPLFKNSITPNFYIIFSKYQKKWRVLTEDNTISRMYITIENSSKYTTNNNDEKRLHEFFGSYKKVIRTDSMVNFIDVNGHEVFSDFFINGVELSDGYFGLFNDEKKVAIFDSTTKQISPFKYTYLSGSGLKKHFYFKENSSSLIGLINLKGEKLIEQKYINLEHLFDNFFVATKSTYGKKGVINIKDEVIVPFDFDDIVSFGDGLFWLKKDNIQKIVNKDGKSVVGPYEYCESMNKNPNETSRFLFCNIFKDSILLVVNPKGKEVLRLKNASGKVKKGFSNQFIVSSSTNSIYNDKGKILLDGDYDSIDTTQIEDLYIIQNKSCDKIEGKLFSTKKGWISTSFSYFSYQKSYEYDRIKRNYWEFDEKDLHIIIRGSLNNIEKTKKVNKPISIENENENTITVIFNGISTTYPQNAGYDYVYNKESIYFYKGRYGVNRDYFDSNLKKIIPQDYICRRVIDLGNTFFFEVTNKKYGFEGIIDIKGKLIIKSKDFLLIKLYDKNYISLDYENSYNLYNSDFQKINKKKYKFERYEIHSGGIISAKTIQGNKLDFFNEKGEIISEGVYNEIKHSEKDYIVV